ncbi:hypothetical protein PR08_gp22 [Idiomarinaceae phage Phi1M2-2]|uniref:hypothetical protein n=1 Tax=Idiomarinaceae phage Phi1M2-2 TaxID=1527515 RepID=UPI0004F6FBF2|nr:hypothetical protein PR08_gp22 [Idiomarinaceae phage Phi1M2-2]AIM40779.1 hypothetical protein M22_022 [Idiomarinaceae phage Phi1M2-2]
MKRWKFRHDKLNNGEWCKAEVLKQGGRAGNAVACYLLHDYMNGSNLKWFSTTQVRPIQSHRDKVLASAEHAIESKTGEPANSTHLVILYDIGALKLPEGDSDEG